MMAMGITWRHWKSSSMLRCLLWTIFLLTKTKRITSREIFHPGEISRNTPPLSSAQQCKKDRSLLCKCSRLTNIPGNKTANQTIKLGVLLPWEMDESLRTSGFHGAKYYASAMCIAADDVNTHETLLANHSIEIVWANTMCDWKSAVQTQYKMMHDEGVDAFIGGGCNRVCKIAAKVAGAFNMPMVSHSCNDPELSSIKKYPTFASTEASNGRQLTSVMRELLPHFKWKKFAVVVQNSSTYFHIGEDMKREFKDAIQHYEVVNYDSLHYNFTAHFPMVKKNLSEISQKARIILLLTDIRTVKEFLIAAYELDLLGGEYVFVAYALHLTFGYHFLEKPWHWITADNTGNHVAGTKGYYERCKKLCLAWDAVLLVMTKLPNSKSNEGKLKKFYTRVKEGMKTRLNTSVYETYPNNVSKPTFYAINLYDAIMSYAVTVGDTINKREDFQNGTTILKNMAEKTFTSIRGYPMHFDESGEVQYPFVIYHYGQWSGAGERCLRAVEQTSEKTSDVNFPKMEAVLELNIRSVRRRVKPNTTEFRWQFKVSKIPSSYFHWPGNSSIYDVKDEPDCGFDGEKCLIDKKKRDYVGIAVALTVVAMLLIVTPIVIYRQYKFERELANQLWKISINELQFDDWKGSVVSFDSVDADSSQHSGYMKLTTAEQAPRKQRIATYNGNVVNVRTVYKKTVDLNRTVLMELKQVRDLRHSNINPFIGACVDSHNILIITQYGIRGSLQDILLNHNIKLDTLFCLSLIQDIVKGMKYLHSSDIKSHGSLKSSNCIIDSRWILKVTDFGLHQFKSKQSTSDINSPYYHSQLLWHAPEILRIDEIHGKGTQKGDIYSFAIIIQEFHTRGGPWCTTDLKPWDIIERLKKIEIPPFRPQVSQLIDKAEPLRELMKRCWCENPDERPSFSDIQRDIENLMKSNGLKTNMLDNMVEMMEKYTDDLEDIVRQRTDEVRDEKAKTEALLMQVLPESVARQLIKGQEVEAESFPEVSIYFSDIVGFTSLCADSSPMQVVSLLNDLYTLFDNVISNYEVYKVETIGDAYMVVSGLPKRNGRKHASEISLMSLHILKAVKTFKIKHRPNEQLLVRIGLHSGPVVAGVVGKTMPRYCLFGDTVNFSSRMESTGEALRIHISPNIHSILEELGGFVCDERGETFLKGIGNVTTYWLISSRHKEREACPSRPTSMMNVPTTLVEYVRRNSQGGPPMNYLSPRGAMMYPSGSPIAIARSFERLNSRQKSEIRRSRLNMSRDDALLPTNEDRDASTKNSNGSVLGFSKTKDSDSDDDEDVDDIGGFRGRNGGRENGMEMARLLHPQSAAGIRSIDV